ncbi:hypothetical protein DEJ34_03865 [Curtobacterium sp. MCPF17_050]|uniref:hypothetical protein n=1 Tax=Curtobacterium sp. MCPF17_050 TaxID=2175664 RepID=UPI000D8FF3F0|nr:hypothetical protein [Curtobacterium sp. MCPF17_050]WIB16280.1 hypothetical protein DEJ34_03865 [Curtobacterium sp. MCPF17_050]
MSSTLNTATTTLDDDVTRPSTTAPGDGPADTTDPNQVAASARPAPGPQALASGIVNAFTLVIPKPRPTTPNVNHRTETYTTTAPNGTTVTVRRDLETGDTQMVDA